MANIVNITFKLHFQKEMSFSLFFFLLEKLLLATFCPIQPHSGDCEAVTAVTAGFSSLC